MSVIRNRQHGWNEHTGGCIKSIYYLQPNLKLLRSLLIDFLQKLHNNVLSQYDKLLKYAYSAYFYHFSSNKLSFVNDKYPFPSHQKNKRNSIENSKPTTHCILLVTRPWRKLPDLYLHGRVFELCLFKAQTQSLPLGFWAVSHTIVLGSDNPSKRHR